AMLRLGLLARDRRTGVLAALLLMINPLYRLHARRAMADVPAEALILGTAALALWAWDRTLSGRLGLGRGLASVVGVGVLGGLAVLAKLNGGLGLMTVAAWAVLGIVLVRFPTRRRVGFATIAAVAGVVSLVVFVAL